MTFGNIWLLPLCLPADLANCCSRTFHFSLAVLILQGGILVVTFFNLVDIGPDGTQSKLGIVVLLEMDFFVCATT
jgi:hypothetical protein